MEANNQEATYHAWQESLGVEPGTSHEETMARYRDVTGPDAGGDLRTMEANNQEATYHAWQESLGVEPGTSHEETMARYRDVTGPDAGGDLRTMEANNQEATYHAWQESLGVEPGTSHEETMARYRDVTGPDAGGDLRTMEANNQEATYHAWQESLGVEPGTSHEETMARYRDVTGPDAGGDLRTMEANNQRERFENFVAKELKLDPATATKGEVEGRIQLYQRGLPVDLDPEMAAGHILAEERVDEIREDNWHNLLNDLGLSPTASLEQVQQAYEIQLARSKGPSDIVQEGDEGFSGAAEGTFHERETLPRGLHDKVFSDMHARLRERNEAKIAAEEEARKLDEAYREEQGDTNIGIQDFLKAAPGEILGQAGNIFRRLTEGQADLYGNKWIPHEERTQVALPVTSQYLQDVVREGASFGSLDTKSFNPEGGVQYADRVITEIGPETAGFVRNEQGVYVPISGDADRAGLTVEALSQHYYDQNPSAGKAAAEFGIALTPGFGTAYTWKDDTWTMRAINLATEIPGVGFIGDLGARATRAIKRGVPMYSKPYAADAIAQAQRDQLGARFVGAIDSADAYLAKQLPKPPGTAPPVPPSRMGEFFRGYYDSGPLDMAANLAASPRPLYRAGGIILHEGAQSALKSSPLGRVIMKGADRVVVPQVVKNPDILRQSLPDYIVKSDEFLDPSVKATLDDAQLSPKPKDVQARLDERPEWLKRADAADAAVTDSIPSTDVLNAPKDPSRIGAAIRGYQENPYIAPARVKNEPRAGYYGAGATARQVVEGLAENSPAFRQLDELAKSPAMKPELVKPVLPDSIVRTDLDVAPPKAAAAAPVVETPGPRPRRALRTDAGRRRESGRVLQRRGDTRSLVSPSLRRVSDVVESVEMPRALRGAQERLIRGLRSPGLKNKRMSDLLEAKFGRPTEAKRVEALLEGAETPLGAATAPKVASDVFLSDRPLHTLAGAAGRRVRDDHGVDIERFTRGEFVSSTMPYDKVLKLSNDADPNVRAIAFAALQKLSQGQTAVFELGGRVYSISPGRFTESLARANPGKQIYGHVGDMSAVANPENLVRAPGGGLHAPVPVLGVKGVVKESEEAATFLATTPPTALGDYSAFGFRQQEPGVAVIGYRSPGQMTVIKGLDEGSYTDPIAQIPSENLSLLGARQTPDPKVVRDLMRSGMIDERRATELASRVPIPGALHEPGKRFFIPAGLDVTELEGAVPGPGGRAGFTGSLPAFQRGPRIGGIAGGRLYLGEGVHLPSHIDVTRANVASIWDVATGRQPRGTRPTPRPDLSAADVNVRPFDDATARTPDQQAYLERSRLEDPGDDALGRQVKSDRARLLGQMDEGDAPDMTDVAAPELSPEELKAQRLARLSTAQLRAMARLDDAQLDAMARGGDADADLVKDARRQIGVGPEEITEQTERAIATRAFQMKTARVLEDPTGRIEDLDRYVTEDAPAAPDRQPPEGLDDFSLRTDAAETPRSPEDVAADTAQDLDADSLERFNLEQRAALSNAELRAMADNGDPYAKDILDVRRRSGALDADLPPDPERARFEAQDAVNLRSRRRAAGADRSRGLEGPAAAATGIRGAASALPDIVDGPAARAMTEQGDLRGAPLLAQPLDSRITEAPEATGAIWTAPVDDPARETDAEFFARIGRETVAARDANQVNIFAQMEGRTSRRVFS